MKISAVRLGKVVIISLVGSLDTQTAEQASSFFSSQVREGALNLVADLSQVEYISSAGLRVILATGKAVRLVGGDLRLAAVPAVRPVLELSGFSSIFNLYPQLEEAVGSFAA
jgi:anti-sigma B factor antagonist